MLGQLPTELSINGRMFEIRADFRNILQIIAAFNDDELTDNEKVYICLKRFFADFDNMEKQDFEEAYKGAVAFIECGASTDNKPKPRLINWEKDEQLIFPAINKAAGIAEVRELPYMHWWTFMGYFQNIDRDDIWGFILTIRQKKSKGQKLEKHEKEFYNANRELCRVEFVKERKNPADSMEEIYNQLLKEGGGK